MRQHPNFPWLDADDPAGLASYLSALGWLQPGEGIVSCGPAGDGNMNLTLRVRTTRREVVLKQARPWVEKYDHIPAPWDRGRIEQRFYARVAEIPGVAERMPCVLAADQKARVLLLDHLRGASDLTTLYAGDALRADEVRELGEYLALLHAGTAHRQNADLANREMRALNHEHIFVIPLDPANGLELEPLEAGLSAAARSLAGDARFCEAVRATGARYLEDGPCLVHGDFFPGSWLRSSDGLRVIDPEFCFPGDPEVDVGVMLAHLALSEQEPALAEALVATYTSAGGPELSSEWLARFAAVEVVRRLIGVAQLPIPQSLPDSSKRVELLARAHHALLAGDPSGLQAGG